ncbi:MAG: hypothetical protein M1517_00890 [Deltaproteobacteria bacterium]|nr:hypothetical protein [Deltaproteobacteria bacterium]
MGLIEQKERVFDTAKGNTSGLPAMLLLSRYGNTETLWVVTPFTEKSFVLRAEEKTLSS